MTRSPRIPPRSINQVAQRVRSLVSLVRSGRDPCYHVTERGKVYIEHIRRLPLPVEVKTWEMPSSVPVTK